MLHIPGEAPKVFQQSIDAFLQELRAAGRSRDTIRGYGWHLYRFARWLENERQAHTLADVTRENALAWISNLWEHYQPSTIKQSGQALRAWVRWLYARGEIDKNFAKEIPVPHVGISPQRTLTTAEVRRLFAVCDSSTPKGARDIAIMAVLLDTGLRASELIRLRLEDWQESTRKIMVLGKGRKKASVWCSVECAEHLQRWLAHRSKIAKPEEDHLFVAVGGYTPGKALTRRGLRVILQKLGKQAQVEDVHPHAFRRTFAVMALQAGVPTRVLQIMGRWEDLKMVERYSQALLAEQVWKTVQGQGKSPLALIGQDKQHGK